MKNYLDSDPGKVYNDKLKVKNSQGARMRPKVQSVYNRQVAKCLDDISEVMELPSVVIDRIKKSIEFTCKDVDKLKNKSPNGDNQNEQTIKDQPHY